MQIVNKLLQLKKTEILTVDYIEQNIKEMGFEPLRWAIIGEEKEQLLIEAVLYTY